MRTVVWRDSMLAPAIWQQVFVSPGVSATGAPLGDAWGHTITLHQGVSGKPAIPAVSWRTSTREGLVAMQVATSAEWGTPGTWLTGDLTGGADVPWEATDRMGLYQGLSVMEICVVEPCPPQTAAWPAIPFIAAWPDNRSASAKAEIWTRKFEH